MRILLASLVLFAVAGITEAQPGSLEYRFDSVKRTVTLTTTAREAHPASRGQLAHSGDQVSTGLFSYALIVSDHYRARFELFGSTDVTLSSGTPGMILSLERGRLRAAFDKITGNEPRVVKTPGALLAVRGTRYDVSVDNSGRTTLDVVEGIVEVRSPLAAQPLLIRAGERSVFSSKEPPNRHDSPPGAGRNDGSDGRQNDPRGRDGRGSGSVDGRDNSGDRRGSPPPPPPPPPPPHGGPGPHL